MDQLFLHERGALRGIFYRTGLFPNPHFGPFLDKMCDFGESYQKNGKTSERPAESASAAWGSPTCASQTLAQAPQVPPRCQSRQADAIDDAVLMVHLCDLAHDLAPAGGPARGDGAVPGKSIWSQRALSRFGAPEPRGGFKAISLGDFPGVSICLCPGVSICTLLLFHAS